MSDIEEMKSKEQEIQSKSSGWIQKLKNESWEAELLVSAIAIYGTYKLFNIINWSTNIFINYLPKTQYIIGYFIVFMGLLAISILASMFLIHFFLRAYWIGLVGLNSVFPDYSIKDSAYSEIFTKKITNILPKLKDSIHSIDEICSVIFSAAFSLLLMYMYFAISSSLYLLLYNVLIDLVPRIILLFPLVIFAVIFLLQIVISTIANLKRTRENELIQDTYFKLMKISYIINIGPLYKSLLQIFMIFGSNFKRKKSLIKLVILFLAFGFIISSFYIFKTNLPVLISASNNMSNSLITSNYYKNANKDLDFLLSPEIDSEIIESTVTKLFIPIYKHEKRMAVKTCGQYLRNKELSKDEQRKAKNEFNIDCYEQYHMIYLNGKKITPDFKKCYHQITDQLGIYCYINLDDAKKGENEILIQKILDGGVYSEWSIPFYYTIRL